MFYARGRWFVEVRRQEDDHLWARWNGISIRQDPGVQQPGSPWALGKELVSSAMNWLKLSRESREREECTKQLDRDHGWHTGTGVQDEQKAVDGGGGSTSYPVARMGVLAVEYWSG